MKSVITGTGNPAWSGCNMPSPKPGRSPACGPHIKMINTSSTRFPQRFRRSRCHRRGHGWHCPCRCVPRGQKPVFIRAPRSPAGPGRRGKAGFGQAGADRSGFKRPGSSPQYIAGRTASAWPAPRLHRGGAGPGAPATVGRHLPCVSVVPARRRRGGQGRRAVVLGPGRPSPRGGLAMDAPGCRVRSERHLRPPGPRLRRGGRRAAGGRIAAVLRSVRRGCATWGLSLRSPGRQGRRSRKPGRLRTRLPARFRRGSAPRQSGVALPLGVIRI